MLKMKRSLAVAAMLFAAVSATRADVLDKLPADAMLAGKVANLEATSGKVARLAKDFGIDGFVVALKDPLDALQKRSHFEKGFNKGGEFGFAVMSSKLNGGLGGQPAVVMLVPISNYAEFISNFADAKTEGAVSEVTIGANKEPNFVADWGEFAAISPTKALVGKPTNTLKVTGFGAAEAKRQDMLFYANFEKITPEAMPELEKGLEKALAEIDRDNPEIDAKYKPTIKVLVSQVFGVMRGFLRDANSATYGINISDAGINATIAADFKADSYSAKQVAQLKGTDAPLTNGLPVMKYHAFGGAAYDPGPMVTMVDDFSKPILDELGKIEGMQSVKTLAESVRAGIKANHGATFGMPVPAKIGQDAIIQQVNIYRGGAKEWKTAIDQSAEVMTAFLKDMKMPEGQEKPSLVRDAEGKTIEGIKFDSWKLDFPVNKDDPGAAQEQMMLSTMYGGDGMHYLFGQVGQNDLLMASSVKDETVATFIKATLANDDAVGKLEQVKAVKAELPKTRVYEAYIALDEMVNTGVATAATMGMPIPVQLPPDLPPVGMTLGTEKNAVRIDVHIPSTTVQSLIAAGMQVFMQMQRGGGGNL
jgi:hypothetical protein